MIRSAVQFRWVAPVKSGTCRNVSPFLFVILVKFAISPRHTCFVAGYSIESYKLNMLLTLLDSLNGERIFQPITGEKASRQTA